MVQSTLRRQRHQLIALTWVQAGAEDTLVPLMRRFYRHQQCGWCRVLTAVARASLVRSLYRPANYRGKFGDVEDARPPIVRGVRQVELVDTTHARAGDPELCVTAAGKLKCFAQAADEDAGGIYVTGTRTDPAPY
ncbi:hypothetical protein GCM10023084_53760 [Streptomyces lacrimifluminis]|uniref:Uncharacterized protein n=1 Tax=Streptomyces lacrimifluminis TaxID=1500077 RepID=A0A917KXF3_9ACTN|nr:hypothetical protein GCM10012282_34100 [Streptomyces lacrimifluminis]